MAAAVRRGRRRHGARRRCRHVLVALATLAVLAGSGSARAQFAGSLGVASENRYRGTGTGDVGPVLRASVMGDSTAAWSDGAYAGLSGLWRTRDGGLANAEAMLGWSGRWNEFGPLATLDPGWGWDVGAHRTHYGARTRYDFNEAMVGLLGPGVSARVWWSPHYFGGPWSSLYSELNGNLDLDDHWRLFAHVGVLRYGNTGPGRRIPGRTDALVGAGYVIDRFDVRLTRDGLVTGRPIDDIDDRMRRPAWVLSGSVAF